uniref:G protein-coupled receptor n=1 Tax=Plectus sambesii TaxID=2011161 RepID=A0A914X9Q0_9BILA
METPYDPTLPDLMSTMAGYFIRLILVICGVCYAFSIRAIWKYRHQTIVQTAAKRRSAAREAGFTLVSLVTFILLCLYYVRMESMSRGWSNIYYQIGTYAGDIRSFINPYTIFLVSKPVRNAMRNQLAALFPRLLKYTTTSTANLPNNQITIAAINNATLMIRHNRSNGTAWA